MTTGTKYWGMMHAKISGNLEINRRIARGSRLKHNQHRRQQILNSRFIDMANLKYPVSKTCTTIINEDKKVSISIMNSQSIKNKNDHILHHLRDGKANFVVIIETWLRDNDMDKIWMDTCELNKNRYKLQVQNRGEGRGRGRDNITVKKVDGSRCPSFEFAVWSVKFPTVHLTLITIYHPCSTMQNNMDNQFIDQFTEWLSENLVILPNILIMGNFNIHINFKEVDNSAHIFTDTLEALGLQIHNDFPVHKLGNTLDILIMEINSQIQIDKCWAGPFILEHCTIEASLSISRSDLTKKNHILKT